MPSAKAVAKKKAEVKKNQALGVKKTTKTKKVSKKAEKKKAKTVSIFASGASLLTPPVLNSLNLLTTIPSVTAAFASTHYVYSCFYFTMQ